jgi:hypothetical protein
LKTLNDESAQHRHLLIEIGPNRVGTFRQDVEVFCIEPGWSARYGAGADVPCGQEDFQRIAARDQLAGSLHADKSANCHSGGVGLVVATSKASKRDPGGWAWASDPVRNIATAKMAKGFIACWTWGRREVSDLLEKRKKPDLLGSGLIRFNRATS